MESLIVHPKNQMELNALKSVMKDMGIRYEKFHTRNTKDPRQNEKTFVAKRPTKNFKDKPKSSE
jgi:hypothetical protein